MRPTGLQKQTSKQTKQWLLLKVAILYVYKKKYVSGVRGPLDALLCWFPLC